MRRGVVVQVRDFAVGLELDNAHQEWRRVVIAAERGLADLQLGYQARAFDGQRDLVRHRLAELELVPREGLRPAPCERKRADEPFLPVQWEADVTLEPELPHHGGARIPRLLDVGGHDRPPSQRHLPAHTRPETQAGYVGPDRPCSLVRGQHELTQLGVQEEIEVRVQAKGTRESSEDARGRVGRTLGRKQIARDPFEQPEVRTEGRRSHPSPGHAAARGRVRASRRPPSGGIRLRNPHRDSRRPRKSLKNRLTRRWHRPIVRPDVLAHRRSKHERTAGLDGGAQRGSRANSRHGAGRGPVRHADPPSRSQRTSLSAVRVYGPPGGSLHPAIRSRQRRNARRRLAPD